MLAGTALALRLLVRLCLAPEDIAIELHSTLVITLLPVQACSKLVAAPLFVYGSCVAAKLSPCSGKSISNILLGRFATLRVSLKRAGRWLHVQQAEVEWKLVAWLH